MQKSVNLKLNGTCITKKYKYKINNKRIYEKSFLKTFSYYYRKV